MLAGFPLNRNGTEEIKYTELEFSNGSTKLANGLKAFLLAHTFLSAVFLPGDKAAIDFQENSDFGVIILFAILGVLGVVILILFLRCIICYIKNAGEPNRFEKAIRDTFALPWKNKRKLAPEIETGQYSNGATVTTVNQLSDNRQPDGVTKTPLANKSLNS
ncbi:unnamed protein product [Caenorhabditis nigoni]